MNKRDLKRKIVLLDVFLVLGLMSQAFILYLTNKYLSFTTVAGSTELGRRRYYFWLEAADVVGWVCLAIYVICCIVLINSMISQSFPFRKAILFFLIQILLIFASVISVAVFDVEYFFDYLFPIWKVLVWLFLCFCYYLLRKLYQFYKGKF